MEKIEATHWTKLNSWCQLKLKIDRSFFSDPSVRSFFKMSFPTFSVYANLIASFPTWSALYTHLTATLKLRVEDYSLPDSPYALIRYVKGQTDLSNPVSRAFRSVVWDTIAHRPVSVTSWKSADGESLPDGPITDYRVEPFYDGTLIGLFWDTYSGRWRIHTRSILDARCRYYSNTKTFADMFWGLMRDADLSALNRAYSYSFILQHPENRIVCAVSSPRSQIVDICAIDTDGTIVWNPTPPNTPLVPRLTDWVSVRSTLSEFNTRFGHNYQGFVVKSADGRRWKLRTPEYNRVRALRGNSPRRDYLWLKAWRDDKLRDYLRLFPEERRDADAMVARWKTVTTDVYHIYCDVFKARSMDRKSIPPKYRPLVYGLHSLYIETLKPAGKTVDWKACLEFMNTKDVAQMLFVLNWEYRQALRDMGASAIPIEPPSAIGTTVDAKVETEPSSTGSAPDVPESVTTS